MRFEDAYDKYVGDVYAFLRYRLTAEADAEDLTQATFERALISWERFDPERGSMASWLLAIARNVLRDHLRAQGRVERLSDSVRNELRRRQAVEAGEVGDDGAIYVALGRLAERERELIALRFGAGLSAAEIADVTGLSVANVHQIQSRALRQLRETIPQSAAAKLE